MKAAASLPTTVHPRFSVAALPDPEPPLGVMLICAEPLLPGVVTPTKLIVVPNVGWYANAGGNAPSGAASALVDIAANSAPALSSRRARRVGRKLEIAVRCMGRHPQERARVRHSALDCSFDLPKNESLASFSKRNSRKWWHSVAIVLRMPAGGHAFRGPRLTVSAHWRPRLLRKLAHALAHAQLAVGSQ